jgi:calcium-dependent protein kinase
LLSGKVPFPGESNKEIIENVLRADYHFEHDAFKCISDQAKDLISHLLVKDVNRRYTAIEAYNHPWIQNAKELSSLEIAGDAFTNMKNFMDAVNLKKATLTYLASKLPERYLEDLRRTFIFIDSNGDGRIESSEFKKSLMRVGADFSDEEIM